jgi:hypothetical protein
MLEVLKDTELSQESESEEEYTEYGIDFDTGQLTGEKVSGKEALKVWAFFALKIQRYRFRIFTFDYGCESENLIGTNYGFDYNECEIKRLIAECLLVNPYITDVSNFTVSLDGGCLKVEFTLETIYGDTQMTESFEI